MSEGSHPAQLISHGSENTPVAKSGGPDSVAAIVNATANAKAGCDAVAFTKCDGGPEPEKQTLPANGNAASAVENFIRH